MSAGQQVEVDCRTKGGRSIAQAVLSEFLARIVQSGSADAMDSEASICSSIHFESTNDGTVCASIGSKSE